MGKINLEACNADLALTFGRIMERFVDNIDGIESSGHYIIKEEMEPLAHSYAGLHGVEQGPYYDEALAFEVSVVVIVKEDEYDICTPYGCVNGVLMRPAAILANTVQRKTSKGGRRIKYFVRPLYADMNY